jgi:hypothetical protein
MINRLLGQQLDLRRQLATVAEADTNGQPPLLQALLEQHTEAVGRSLDGLAGEVHKMRGALDFLKAMIDRSTHELLAAAAPAGEVAQRYDRWIAGVKRLLQGHMSEARPKGEARGHQNVGDYAARAVFSIGKSGYQRRKVEGNSLFSVLTRVCSSKCAPRLVHCIDWRLTKRLLIT